MSIIGSGSISPGGEPDGRTAAVLFLTGYLIEKSLGLDNLFFIALIFSYFRIPTAYQHRVLYWGIVGAVIMRAERGRAPRFISAGDTCGVQRL